MRTPITYYGGKQRLAQEIISMMPKHTIYCEPYFGGGAVFFAKPKANIEVINDIDDNLINFYSCVQNNFEELDDLIQQTLHSESMYLFAKDIWNGRTDATDIERAWAIWMITNGSYAGSMHGGWKWCNGSSGGHTATFIKNKRSEFSTTLHERLDNVQISCRDAIKVINDRDTPDTLFYLDPPYPGSYQGHYAVFTIEHLKELLDVLINIKGMFILSNYWTNTLEEYIQQHDWKYKEIVVNVMVARLGRRKTATGQRTEVLVYNYDVAPGLFD